MRPPFTALETGWDGVVGMVLRILHTVCLATLWLLALMMHMFYLCMNVTFFLVLEQIMSFSHMYIGSCELELGNFQDGACLPFNKITSIVTCPSPSLKSSWIVLISPTCLSNFLQFCKKHPLVHNHQTVRDCCIWCSDNWSTFLTIIMVYLNK